MLYLGRSLLAVMLISILTSVVSHAADNNVISLDEYRTKQACNQILYVEPQGANFKTGRKTLRVAESTDRGVEGKIDLHFDGAQNFWVPGFSEGFLPYKTMSIFTQLSDINKISNRANDSVLSFKTIAFIRTPDELLPEDAVGSEQFEPIEGAVKVILKGNSFSLKFFPGNTIENARGFWGNYRGGTLLLGDQAIRVLRELLKKIQTSYEVFEI